MPHPDRVRSLVRAVALVCAVVLLAWSDESRRSLWVPALSPLVAVASPLATWKLPAFLLPGIALALLTVFRRRWFCRWLCPTGTCADTASWLGRRLGRRRPRLPGVGQAIALVILGSACLGYPVLLWLDPLALFSSPFGRIASSTSLAARAGLAAFALLAAASLIWPGAWCARFCPLGGWQDLLARAGLQVQRHRARAALGSLPIASPTPADDSGSCRGISGDTGRTHGFAFPRRTVLGLVAGAAGGAGMRWAVDHTGRPLRPPGSVDERIFSGLCVRCGNCARVCPSEIIVPDPGRHGLAGLFAPVVSFEQDYCLETCVRCGEVCPSGAIRPLELIDKPRQRMGVPHVDMNLCLLGEDRECAICRNRCPYEAIRLEFSEVEYTLTPRVDLARCNGCGACQAACPTTPSKAIVVERV